MNSLNRMMILVGALTILTMVVAAPAADRFDAALKTALDRVDHNKQLSDAERAKARLDLIGNFRSAAELASKSIDDLQIYAQIVQETGLCFDYDLKHIKQFSEKIEALTSLPSIKAARKAGELAGKIHGYASKANTIRTQVAQAAKILRESKDLPPGARRSLAALSALGSALQHAGDVPGLGACLDAYGQVTEKFVGMVQKTNERIVYNLQGGALMGKKLPELAGLPKNYSTSGYQRTELWRIGVPVIKGTQNQGADDWFLRGDSGLWVRISEKEHEQVKAITAQWMMVNKKKLPKPNEILKLLNDPDACKMLAASARDDAAWILLKERVSKIMVDPDKPLKEALKEFNGAQDKLKAWSGDLNVPMDRDSMDIVTRLYIKSPKWAERWFRAKVYNLYPEIKAAFERKGIDPSTVTVTQLQKTSKAYMKYVADVAAGKRKPIKHVAVAPPKSEKPPVKTSRPVTPDVAKRGKQLPRIAPPPKGVGNNSARRSEITAWRDAQIRVLQVRMNNDPLRAENKRLALQGVGKNKHMACGGCAKKVVHWWMSGSWTCSGCEYATTVQDRKRPDGLTFRQYASARMKVYQDQINAVRNQAAAMLKQSGR